MENIETMNFGTPKEPLHPDEFAKQQLLEKKLHAPASEAYDEVTTRLSQPLEPSQANPDIEGDIKKKTAEKERLSKIEEKYEALKNTEIEKL